MMKACSIFAVAALASSTAVDAVKMNSPSASPEPRRRALRGGGSPVPQTEELTRDTELPSMPPMPSMPDFGGVTMPDGVTADEYAAGMRAMTKMMAQMGMRQEAMRDEGHGSMSEALDAHPEWHESDEDFVPDADQQALKAVIERHFWKMGQMLGAGMSFEEINEVQRREQKFQDAPEFQKWLGDVHAAQLPSLAESLGVSEADAHRHAMAGTGVFAGAVGAMAGINVPTLSPDGEFDPTVAALSTTWGQAMHGAAELHEIE